MTGCGIYKPYTRPEVKTDGLYGTAETADTTTIGNLGWEEMFTDPYLRTLIPRGWRTIPTCNRRNGGSRKPRRRLSRRAWLTCRRSTSHLRAA